MIKYLGIDWGEKRIGLALADDESRVALPWQTVANLQAVLEAVAEEEIGLIVLGAPRKMGGGEANNPLWLNFFQGLKKAAPCPIELRDERLSSLAADALPGSRKQKAGRDEIAAVLILQEFLDRTA